MDDRDYLELKSKYDLLQRDADLLKCEIKEIKQQIKVFGDLNIQMALLGQSVEQLSGVVKDLKDKIDVNTAKPAKTMDGLKITAITVIITYIITQVLEHLFK